MLNRTQGGEEAVVRYEDSDFTVLKNGRFVRCAVTNQPIPLDELRYWNVDRQEAYVSAEIALQRWRELNGASA